MIFRCNSSVWNSQRWDLSMWLSCIRRNNSCLAYTFVKQGWLSLAIVIDRSTWCHGCLEVSVPGSGGLLISIEWTAVMFGPTKFSTTSNNLEFIEYSMNTGSHRISCILLTTLSWVWSSDPTIFFNVISRIKVIPPVFREIAECLWTKIFSRLKFFYCFITILSQRLSWILLFNTLILNLVP